NKLGPVFFTPGGLIDASVKISESIIDTNIPTIALIKNEAISAGVLIAISCDKIYMIPGSNIGAAEPRPKEEKIVSYWTSKLESVAEMKGRDEKIIAAMADADIEIPGIVEKGKLLSLTAGEAEEHGIADGIVNSRKELFNSLDLQIDKTIEMKPTPGEKVSGIITNPYISPILLTVGFAGIIIEILTPGFGLPGTIGIISLVFYFGGHVLSGLAGFEAIVFFLLGIILLTVEAFIPGFGIFGFLGIFGIIASIVTSSPDFYQAISTIVISFVATIIILIITFKYISKIEIFSKFILNETQEENLGYKSSEEKLNELLGRTGKSITPLRPSGIITIDDNRIDALTRGEFIKAEEKVKIIKVEGRKVIVEPKKK
ncbi:MAG TPA: nodulation protein NfeD, partial [Thermoanaerobacterales bacterium]|nr:nodulation protein NfeD [Thermoanaerobacterales bacterium]